MALHPIITAHAMEFDRIREHLKEEFRKLHTGKASPALLEHVVAEAYGVKTPIPQLASIAVSDARTLLIEPWDKGLLKAIEKGIIEANIGVSPVVDGERVRLVIPQMTEETRLQLTKRLKEKLEEGRIALRHVRDTIRDVAVTQEREKEISEDDRYRIQRDLDERVKQEQTAMEEITKKKEQEIMTI